MDLPCPRLKGKVGSTPSTMTDDATPRTSAPQDQYSRINPFPETTILGLALQQDLVQAIQDFYRVSDDPAANDA
ncbi:hypothetical protein HYQ46_008920 [Verticillium longisporum]|nr:hypothetical protein HYQ44_002513 [Verticillium longisporum]KAG7135419.1 hypothetical protein HYQ46_008920 [Verticillium longisporum]